MNLSAMSLQAASRMACDPAGVTPRPARKRKRGVTPQSKKQSTKKQPQFHVVIVGGEMEVSDGYLERWQVVEEPPNRWGEIRRFRERMRDEDGFLTSKWVETGRRKIDNRTAVSFPVDEFPKPPKAAWFENGENGEILHWSFGGDGLTWWMSSDGQLCHRGTLKGTKPNPPRQIEWLKPVPADHPAREAFVAKRDEWLAALQPGKLEPKLVVAIKEQWFMLAVPDVAKQDLAWGSEHDWAERDYQPPDARANFPDGWCCKLVQPQPSGHLVRGDRGFNEHFGWVAYDPGWAYVQFPVPYWIVDDKGRWHRLTDQKRKGASSVECGMWVPRWLLTPTPADQVKPVYDWLLAEYAKA